MELTLIDELEAQIKVLKDEIDDLELELEEATDTIDRLASVLEDIEYDARTAAYNARR